jgi:hypothetical protein
VELLEEQGPSTKRTKLLLIMDTRPAKQRCPERLARVAVEFSTVLHSNGKPTRKIKRLGDFQIRMCAAINHRIQAAESRFL